MQNTLRFASFLLAAPILSAQGTVGSFATSGVGCPGLDPATLGTDIAAADDTVNPSHALGFTFPYPDGVGSTTVIDIAPNGYIYLEAGTNTSSRCCNGVDTSGVPVADFFAATPSFALFGQDLNVSTTSATGNGAIFFQTDNSSVATITWFEAGEFGNAGSMNTCSIQLHVDGRVTMTWNDVDLLTHRALVGYSPGNGVADPGPVDFTMQPITGSAGVPIYQGFLNSPFPLDGQTIEFIPDGAGSYIVISLGPAPAVTPLTISSLSVPTTGQTTVIDVTNVPGSAVAGALLVGSAAFNPGVDLSIIGMEGCSLFTNANIGTVAFGNLAPPTATISLPIAPTPGAVGLTFATQAAAIAPGVNSLGVVTSNLGSLTVGDRNPIRIEANGSNSFNSDPSSGFFSITNGNVLDITSVTFDWAASSNAAQATMVFDTDQAGMADRFDGGNSTAAGCLGTYRNGSEVTTGLTFTGTPAASCDPAATTGWTTTGTVGGANTDVTFNFTSFGNGDVFEVDIDTDGGAGITGDSMAGMVVTVTLLGGQTLTGELAAAGTNMARLDL